MWWRRRENGTDASAEDAPDDPAATCTRCDGRLQFLGDRDFHEGTRLWGFALGDLGELLTGGTRLEMWSCESCGHVEFFLPHT